MISRTSSAAYCRAAVLSAGVLWAGLAFAQGGNPTAAAAADPVIAKVNGFELRQSDLAAAEEDIGQQMPPATTEDAKRDYLVGYLSDTILLAQAAEAKKIQDTPDFKKKLASARNKVLMETLLQTEAKASVTDEALKKVYEEAVKQMGGEEEVHARHILFRTDPADEKSSAEAEKKAKAVEERLKKGEDFAKLADDLTEDPSGKSTGGDLGYFTKDQMVPEFAAVAFATPVGKVADPVKSQFGWHVIKVEDKRKRQPPEFDKVKDQLETYVVRKAQVDLVTKLRADAKIERLDKPADEKK